MRRGPVLPNVSVAQWLFSTRSMVSIARSALAPAFFIIFFISFGFF